MNVSRVYAYAVEPSRTVDEVTATGGKLDLTTELKLALEAAAKPIESVGIPIAFALDPSTRTNDVRDLCRAIAFKTASKALASAEALASRLATATDRRSSASLFIVATYSDGDKRRLHMWTFPREEAFEFKAGTEPRVTLLTNIFSKSSRMQKGARFEGGDDRTGFLEGRALDYQATYTLKPIADFWIVRFLHAQLAITSAAGTRMLADCLRKTFDALPEPQEQEQLYCAAIALRAATKGRWSLREFADSYLTGTVHQRFLSSAPNEESATAVFELDHAELETRVDTRLFKLADGVLVSAPFAAVGKGVLIKGAAKKTLQVEGEIVEERLRKKPHRTNRLQ